MKTNILHNSQWQAERMNTLALGYCFSSITVDQKGNPRTSPGQCDINHG
jgi:hypothetical protein